MKKLSLIALVSIVVLGLLKPIWAQDITEEPVTYEVQITLKYNSVSESEAAKLVKQVLAAHGDEACNIDVKVQKNTDDNVLIFTSGTGEIAWPESGANLTSDITLDLKGGTVAR